MIMLLGACGREEIGYVEVKLAPGATLPPIILDGNRIDPKAESSVFRQKVGSIRLQYDRNGILIAVCDINVRKDRIVSVLVTAAGREPRCQIQN